MSVSIENNGVWQRQERESAKAYAAFLLYRDALPSERSVAKVGQEWGKSVSLLERWCSQFQWVKRVRAWDEYLQGLSDEQAIAEVREWKASLKDVTNAAQNAIALKLQNAGSLTPLQIKNAVEAYREAVMMGAFARGLDKFGNHPGQKGSTPQLTKTYAGIDEDEVLGEEYPPDEDETGVE